MDVIAYSCHNFSCIILVKGPPDVLPIIFFISMAQRKTAVSPLQTHLSYCRLALSHRYFHISRGGSSTCHAISHTSAQAWEFLLNDDVLIEWKFWYVIITVEQKYENIIIYGMFHRRLSALLSSGLEHGWIITSMWLSTRLRYLHCYRTGVSPVYI